MSEQKIRGFIVRTDLAYDLDHHLWVDTSRSDVVRVGMDPLGVETSGTLAQLVLHAPGGDYSRGQPVGSLEAEKYVGPVVTPLSGRVIAVNHQFSPFHSRLLRMFHGTKLEPFPRDQQHAENDRHRGADLARGHLLDSPQQDVRQGEHEHGKAAHERRDDGDPVQTEGGIHEDVGEEIRDAR